MRKYGYVKKLAVKCKCSPEHMSYVLNKQRRPSPDLALRISEATGGEVSVMELLFPSSLSLPKDGKEQA
ncbi:MAG: helix-turn-helix domain-containing protein [Syntrophaceae bacterium]|nr:helix-turn-helix domain-containing protein [Syntrophaceae bacterium]